MIKSLHLKRSNNAFVPKDFLFYWWALGNSHFQWQTEHINEQCVEIDEKDLCLFIKNFVSPPENPGWSYAFFITVIIAIDRNL